jgi:hypothetical protein
MNTAIVPQSTNVASPDFFDRLDPEAQMAYVKRLVALGVDGSALTHYFDRLDASTRAVILRREFAEWLSVLPLRPLPPLLQRRAPQKKRAAASESEPAALDLPGNVVAFPGMRPQ